MISRAPLNERVERHGHYLIVCRGEGHFSGIRMPAITVRCQACGLNRACAEWVPEAPLSDWGLASEASDRVLSRFPDPSCDGVRLHLLARLIMET